MQHQKNDPVSFYRHLAREANVKVQKGVVSELTRLIDLTTITVAGSSSSNSSKAGKNSASTISSNGGGASASLSAVADAKPTTVDFLTGANYLGPAQAHIFLEVMQAFPTLSLPIRKLRIELQGIETIHLLQTLLAMQIPGSVAQEIDTEDILAHRKKKAAATAAAAAASLVASAERTMMMVVGDDDYDHHIVSNSSDDNTFNDGALVEHHLHAHHHQQQQQNQQQQQQQHSHRRAFVLLRELHLSAKQEILMAGPALLLLVRKYPRITHLQADAVIFGGDESFAMACASQAEVNLLALEHSSVAAETEAKAAATTIAVAAAVTAALPKKPVRKSRANGSIMGWDELLLDEEGGDEQEQEEELPASLSPSAMQKQLATRARAHEEKVRSVTFCGGAPLCWERRFAAPLPEDELAAEIRAASKAHHEADAGMRKDQMRRRAHIPAIRNTFHGTPIARIDPACGVFDDEAAAVAAFDRVVTAHGGHSERNTAIVRKYRDEAFPVDVMLAGYQQDEDVYNNDQSSIRVMHCFDATPAASGANNNINNNSYYGSALAELQQQHQPQQSTPLFTPEPPLRRDLLQQQQQQRNAMVLFAPPVTPATAGGGGGGGAIAERYNDKHSAMALQQFTPSSFKRDHYTGEVNIITPSRGAAARSTFPDLDRALLVLSPTERERAQRTPAAYSATSVVATYNSNNNHNQQQQQQQLVLSTGDSALLHLPSTPAPTSAFFVDPPSTLFGPGTTIESGKLAPTRFLAQAVGVAVGHNSAGLFRAAFVRCEPRAGAALVALHCPVRGHKVYLLIDDTVPLIKVATFDLPTTIGGGGRNNNNTGIKSITLVQQMCLLRRKNKLPGESHLDSAVSIIAACKACPWVPLLEKAIAKLYGGYRNLAKSNFQLALSTLLGGSVAEWRFPHSGSNISNDDDDGNNDNKSSTTGGNNNNHEDIAQTGFKYLASTLLHPNAKHHGRSAVVVARADAETPEAARSLAERGVSPDEIFLVEHCFEVSDDTPLSGAFDVVVPSKLLPFQKQQRSFSRDSTVHAASINADFRYDSVFIANGPFASQRGGYTRHPAGATMTTTDTAESFDGGAGGVLRANPPRQRRSIVELMAKEQAEHGALKPEEIQEQRLRLHEQLQQSLKVNSSSSNNNDKLSSSREETDGEGSAGNNINHKNNNATTEEIEAIDSPYSAANFCNGDDKNRIIASPYKGHILSARAAEVLNQKPSLPVPKYHLLRLRSVDPRASAVPLGHQLELYHQKNSGNNNNNNNNNQRLSSVIQQQQPFGGGAPFGESVSYFSASTFSVESSSTMTSHSNPHQQKPVPPAAVGLTRSLFSDGTALHRKWAAKLGCVAVEAESDLLPSAPSRRESSRSSMSVGATYGSAHSLTTTVVATRGGGGGAAGMGSGSGAASLGISPSTSAAAVPLMQRGPGSFRSGALRASITELDDGVGGGGIGHIQSPGAENHNASNRNFANLVPITAPRPGATLRHGFGTVGRITEMNDERSNDNNNNNNNTNNNNNNNSSDGGKFVLAGVAIISSPVTGNLTKHEDGDAAHQSMPPQATERSVQQQQQQREEEKRKRRDLSHAFLVPAEDFFVTFRSLTILSFLNQPPALIHREQIPLNIVLDEDTAAASIFEKKNVDTNNRTPFMSTHDRRKAPGAGVAGDATNGEQQQQEQHHFSPSYEPLRASCPMELRRVAFDKWLESPAFIIRNVTGKHNVRLVAGTIHEVDLADPRLRRHSSKHHSSSSSSSSYRIGMQISVLSVTQSGHFADSSCASVDRAQENHLSSRHNIQSLRAATVPRHFAFDFNADVRYETPVVFDGPVSLDIRLNPRAAHYNSCFYVIVSTCVVYDEEKLAAEAALQQQLSSSKSFRRSSRSRSIFNNFGSSSISGIPVSSSQHLPSALGDNNINNDASMSSQLPPQHRALLPKSTEMYLQAWVDGAALLNSASPVSASSSSPTSSPSRAAATGAASSASAAATATAASSSGATTGEDSAPEVLLERVDELFKKVASPVCTIQASTAPCIEIDNFNNATTLEPQPPKPQASSTNNNNQKKENRGEEEEEEEDGGALFSLIPTEPREPPSKEQLDSQKHRGIFNKLTAMPPTFFSSVLGASATNTKKQIVEAVHRRHLRNWQLRAFPQFVIRFSHRPLAPQPPPPKSLAARKKESLTAHPFALGPMTPLHKHRVSLSSLYAGMRDKHRGSKDAAAQLALQRQREATKNEVSVTVVLHVPKLQGRRFQAKLGMAVFHLEEPSAAATPAAAAMAANNPSLAATATTVRQHSNKNKKPHRATACMYRLDAEKEEDDDEAVASAAAKNNNNNSSSTKNAMSNSKLARGPPASASSASSSSSEDDEDKTLPPPVIDKHAASMRISAETTSVASSVPRFDTFEELATECSASDRWCPDLAVSHGLPCLFHKHQDGPAIAVRVPIMPPVAAASTLHTPIGGTSLSIVFGGSGLGTPATSMTAHPLDAKPVPPLVPNTPPHSTVANSLVSYPITPVTPVVPNSIIYPSALVAAAHAAAAGGESNLDATSTNTNTTSVTPPSGVLSAGTTVISSKNQTQQQQQQQQHPSMNNNNSNSPSTPFVHRSFLVVPSLLGELMDGFSDDIFDDGDGQLEISVSVYSRNALNVSVSKLK